MGIVYVTLILASWVAWYRIGYWHGQHDLKSKGEKNETKTASDPAANGSC